ncbi:MAG: hypothetical protein M3Q55_13980 [Acidobacteriota bacterium]|nr:hypothetical protein [Acidobacteriota bacterium]
MMEVNWGLLVGLVVGTGILIRIERAFQQQASEVAALRQSVKELARLTLSMDKRLWKLEGREPSGEMTDEQLYRSLGL